MSLIHIVPWILLLIAFLYMILKLGSLHRLEEELVNKNKNQRQLEQELKKLKEELNSTMKDPVTHLPSWYLFEDRLRSHIAQGLRYQFNLGLLSISINNLDVLIYSLDEKKRQALQRDIAMRLQSCIRQVDSISSAGKNHFVVLLSQLRKPETAAIVAQRILQVFFRPFTLEQKEFRIDPYIGIAIFPFDGQEVHHLMEHATIAMHRAQKKNKPGYQFYLQDMRESSQRELALYTQFNGETPFQDMVLYYQPIIHTKSQTMFCIEALPYWMHQKFGLIKSQEIYFYAEKHNKINALSEWMLKKACKQFIYWRNLDARFNCLGITMRVYQLEDIHFIYRLSQVLQELFFKPEWLLLEIKTGNEDVHPSILEKAFNMLNYMGVKIAISPSDLQEFFLILKNFTGQYLKIDTEITRELTKNPIASAMIQSLLILAKNLHLQAIVPNIENKEQVLALQQLNCELMQGDYFGEPVLEQEVIKKFAPQRVT